MRKCSEHSKELPELRALQSGSLEAKDFPQQSGLTYRLVTAHRGGTKPLDLMPWLGLETLGEDSFAL